MVAWNKVGFPRAHKVRGMMVAWNMVVGVFRHPEMRVLWGLINGKGIGSTADFDV